MTENLFDRIEPYLRTVSRPSRYLDHEFGVTVNEGADYHIALVYPDTYEIGQSNQAIAVLSDCVNADPTLSAERVFVPWVDLSDIMRREDIELFSLETMRPVRSFDMVGITMPHELACTNILEALDLARIPLLAADRTEDDPIVVGGGPCSYNPEPLASVFDAFCIGEGEQQVPELCRLHRELKHGGATREEVLRAFALRGDIYVPSLFEETGQGLRPVDDEVPAVVVKALCDSFGTSKIGTHTIVPYAEVTHDRYSVELLRGCSRGCRFCQAGMIYRPVREHDPDSIVSAVARGLACTGFDEVSLTSLSTTDYSELPDVLRRLNRMFEGTGTSVSIPSQRLDSFGVSMAYLVAGSKRSGLTFAPEAGTQRLRDVINKNVTDEDLISTMQAAMEAGWRRVKLYFMCGLPGETDDDLRGIGDLVGRALQAARESVDVDSRGNVRIAVSCALFVPKPQTPFQWCGQIDETEIERRVGIIKASMPPKGVDFKWHDPSTSLVEAAISRGGREMSACILQAWRSGARFDAWTERFSLETWMAAAEEAGVDLRERATRMLDLDSPLPWDHISCGVSKSYLRREYERALEGVTTPDCTFETCTGCGVCPSLDCDIALAGDRRG